MSSQQARNPDEGQVVVQADGSQIKQDMVIWA